MTADSQSGPAKFSMEAREDQRVSTMKRTTTPSDCERTRASRKPSLERSMGRTRWLKWRRYSGYRSSVVWADQKRTTMSGAPFRRYGGEVGVCTDDDIPRADFPALDEAVEDVGIGFGECFGGVGRVAAKYDESGVGGVG